jgi:hypothetical protein
LLFMLKHSNLPNTIHVATKVHMILRRVVVFNMNA